MLIWAIWKRLSPMASRDFPGSMMRTLPGAGTIPFALLLLFSRNLRKATHMGKGFWGPGHTPFPLTYGGRFQAFSQMEAVDAAGAFYLGSAFITRKGASYFISYQLPTMAFRVDFLLLDIFLLLTDRSLSWSVPAKADCVSVFIGVLTKAFS